MDECVRQVEQICIDKRYRILSGQSKIKLVDVTPGTREYPRSELVVRCGSGPEGDIASDRNVAPLQPASPKLSCIAGATQACVGPGGCSGGQACRPDGLGFGSCDCGPLKAPGSDAGPSNPTDAPSGS
jgi:hypothetical protein